MVVPSGEAADIGPLLERLAALPGHSAKRDAGMIIGVAGPVDYLLEVGKGTIELVSPAVDDLWVLREVHEAAMVRLVRAADAEGLGVLGCGIQPVTSAEAELMSPKPRYQLLLEAMGRPWLGFAVTASDQLHVDIARDEITPLTNLGNLLTPVVIALCANSGVYGGHAGDQCGRESLLSDVYPEHNRFGMLNAPIDDEVAWVARIAEMDCLIIPVEGDTYRFEGSFADRAAQLPNDEVWAAFQHHERYVWNAARPRGAIGTLELRAACQQPWQSHDAAAALNLGLVCAGEKIAHFLTESLPDPWPHFLDWRRQVARDGLVAKSAYSDIFHGVASLAVEGLQSRGRGEETLLAPILERLRVGRSPAAEGLAAFNSGGLPAYLDHYTVSLSC